MRDIVQDALTTDPAERDRSEPVGRNGRGADDLHADGTASVAALSPPPLAILDSASLFLDLDGTLLELIDRPDEVVADAALRALLTTLSRRLSGRLAIVSGRSLAQIDRILGGSAAGMILAGSHGGEFRPGFSDDPALSTEALDDAHAAFADFAAQNEGVVLEQKTLGVALHYRQAPGVRDAAYDLAETLADQSDLIVQQGKMMVELRLPGGDKGSAIARLMTVAPLSHGIPVFVGDDLTDESGFRSVAALGGAGVLVGDRRPTDALFAVTDTRALRRWLEAFAA